jgi:hypothetical protein
MTLTETLQLKERFLKCEDLRALDYCEKRWLEEKRPVKRWEMFNFIEKMLQELNANGIGYPKVLLLRKKEIQRREFAIQQPGEIPPEVCSCVGGWLPSGMPCPCPKGEPHRTQLRKWGMKV